MIIQGVQVPDALWQPCAVSGVACPAGARFFARLSPLVTQRTDFFM